MANVVRAQVVLQGATGLPADEIVNTFHFDPVDVTAATIEAIAEAVRDFYTVLPTGETVQVLANYIAKSVADNGHEVRCYTYDVATGARLNYEGAPPEHVEAFDFLGRGTEALGMPNEVALCLSMRNTTLVNVPKGQRTGRIYFGPIESAYGIQDDGGYASPTTAIINALGHSAAQLKADAAALSCPWVVWSRPFAGRAAVTAEARAAAGGPARALPALPARDGTLYEVEQLWVDNEFDTQRRRGRNAGTRTTF